MKNTRRIILICISSFILLVTLQIFSSGHGHHAVVQDNNKLSSENTSLKKENKSLKNEVSQLTTENAELENNSNKMNELVSQVVEKLDSTSGIVKKIKNELANEKDKTSRLSNGEQFNFEPIKLPSEDGNKR